MGSGRFARWRALRAGAADAADAADAAGRADASPPTAAAPGALIAQIRDECETMARYALHHGLPVEPDTIAQLGTLIDASAANATPARSLPAAAGDASPRAFADRQALVAIHRRLAALIAPATPQAVALLDAEHRGRHPLAWLGPVPLVRLLTATALGFLSAVVATSLSPYVSSENIDRGFLQSDGALLLWNTLFLLCCAGLGASFATLFQAHRYVAAATYDPKYDASYGARLILGLIAGLIVVEMLPAHLFRNGSMQSFGRPALAMLGGFSATAVHRLLQRLVDTLETLVEGDRSADTEAALRAQRSRAASERAQWQGELAAGLLDLQRSLGASASADAIRERLADFTRAMLAADPIRSAAATRIDPPAARPDKE